MMKSAHPVLFAILSTILLQGCSGGISLFGSGSPSAGTVQAGAPAPNTASREALDDPFAPFDGDSNGIVAKSEFESGLAALYRKDDLNGDGHLDAVETRTVNDRLMAVPGTSPVIDWNADGRVMVQEYASQWRTLFERSDVNRDDVVDAEERAGRARVRKAPPLPKPEFGGYRGRSQVQPAE